MTNGNLAGAASTFMDVMRNQPLSLALVLMNIGLLGFLYYSGAVAHNEREKEMELLYQNRTEMAKLLYSCTPVERNKQP
jgi:hypothetical protein